MTEERRRTIKKLARVDRELAKWKDVESQLDQMEGVDLQTKLDTCEGETELFEMLTLLAEEVKLYEAQANGIKEVIASMKARQERLQKTADWWKAMIGQFVENSGFDTIQTPTITFSISRGRAPLIITDERKIPADYWKREDPTLNRTAIGKALNDGAEIPGVTLGNQPLVCRILVR